MLRRIRMLAVACALHAFTVEAAVLAFGGAEWRVDARSADVYEVAGREVLELDTGTVWSTGNELADAVIEFDLSVPEARLGFGPGSRADPPATPRPAPSATCCICPPNSSTPATGRH